MTTVEDLRQERLKKLEILKGAGMPAFAHSSWKQMDNSEFKERFKELEAEQKEVALAGRVMSKRGHGALSFLDIFDGTERVQVVVKKDELDEEKFELFSKVVDKGDFVDFKGFAFTTQRGAESLLAKDWKMLSKSLIPMPDEWVGVKDEETRLRYRYLDIILNDELRDLIYKRAKFWQIIRDFLLERGFLEVETPILETTPGGAEAAPFVTHHNALDTEVYLRISPELWHKRLMVAGIPKVFEIGRIFRNEGMSAEHAQDYTQVEFYEAFKNFEDGKEMIKELYRRLARELLGSEKFSSRGAQIDLSKEWEDYHFVDIIKKRFDIDALETSKEEVHKKLQEEGIKFDPEATDIGRGLDLLWKSIRKEYIGPGFLVGIPKFMEPLAKPSKEDPRIVERFQVLLAGTEMGKAFNELNDPLDQKERFIEQQALRDAGDEEAQMADMDYVEALEYGMPPTFGFGVSERLFSFMMDKSIREAQIFPLLKSKSKN